MGWRRTEKEILGTLTKAGYADTVVEKIDYALKFKVGKRYTMLYYLKSTKLIIEGPQDEGLRNLRKLFQQSEYYD